MKKAHTLAVVGGVVAALAVGLTVHSRAQTQTVLTAQDAHEIEQLYYTMYEGADFRDFDLWFSVWADDGVFKPPFAELTGKAELADWRRESWGEQTGDSKRRHHFPNIRLVPDSDGGVTGHAYWILLDVSEQEVEIANTGTSRTVFVKTAGGWKIKHHTVYFDADAS